MKLKTLFLRTVLLGLGAFILFLVVLLTFGLMHNLKSTTPLAFWIGYGSLIVSAGLSLTVIAFMFKLLSLIDQKIFFSASALSVVKTIKHLAFGECLVLLGLLPMVYRIANLDDAPGVMVIGFGIVIIPIAITTFITIVQSLLERAIVMHTENTLTI